MTLEINIGGSMPFSGPEHSSSSLQARFISLYDSWKMHTSVQFSKPSDCWPKLRVKNKLYTTYIAYATITDGRCTH